MNQKFEETVLFSIGDNSLKKICFKILIFFTLISVLLDLLIFIIGQSLDPFTIESLIFDTIGLDIMVLLIVFVLSQYIGKTFFTISMEKIEIFRTKSSTRFGLPHSYYSAEDKLMFQVFWKDFQKIEANRTRLPLIPHFPFKKSTHAIRFIGTDSILECNLIRFQEIKRQAILINLETYANKLKKSYIEADMEQ